MSRFKDQSDYSARPPLLFFREQTCDEAWETLLGSKEAMNALWREVVDSGLKINGRAKGALKGIPRGALLSMTVLDPSLFKGFVEKVGDRRAEEVAKLVSLQNLMGRLLGEEIYNGILNDIAEKRADHLLDIVQEAIPEIGEICEAGGFSREIVKSAVLISTLLIKDEELSEGNNVYVMDIALHRLLMSIPQPIIREALISCYGRLEDIYGGRIIEMIADPQELDAESPLFESSPEVSAYYMADIISRSSRQRLVGNSDSTDFYLETIQAFMLASRPDSYLVVNTFETLLLRAQGAWQAWLSLLVDLPLNPGAKIRVENLAEVFIPNEVEQVGHESLAEARLLLASMKEELDCELLDEIHNVVSEIESLHEQLATLLKDKGDFKEIASLSQKGDELSKKLPTMADVALDRLERFSASIARFTAAATHVEEPGYGRSEPPAAVALSPEEQIAISPVEVVPAPDPAPAVVESKNELELELLNANENLERELKESRADVFRLNQLVEALQKRPGQPLGHADEDLASLSARIARGRRLSPEEVLRFYSYTAKDRVEILDSAWKSARSAEHFAQPDKLIEMLGKLIYEYLDEVRKGVPMGNVGREMFSNGFAARESKTVQVTPQMRAQREFVYQGAPRFFEYRLRVGNGWGPVEGMRVYFDVLDNRVVVAYVGPHLEQAGTN